MRIIFDSKEERDEFLVRIEGCPPDVNELDGECKGWNCIECWANTIPHEVKEAK